MREATNNLIDALGPLGLTIVENLPVGILIADCSGLVCYVNEAYGKMWATKGTSEIGLDLNAARGGALASQVLQDGQPVPLKPLGPPGTEQQMLAEAFPFLVNEELQGAVALFLCPTKDWFSKGSGEGRVPVATQVQEIQCGRSIFNDLVGYSRTFLETVKVAERAALGDSTILLRGESGTGKERFAEAIHNASPRRHKPFVKVNCAAIPDNLLESEFFGYEKGAFTGAGNRKIGTFEVANGGTLFLDEIGDMSIHLQAKLLRVLQNGEFTRVGGNTVQNVDVRIISATNRNLEDHVIRGLFREDLYYRLNVVAVNIPPLRERKEDIFPLSQAIIARLKISRRLGLAITQMEPKAVRLLTEYSWPGNIRELENVLERALNMVSNGKTTLEASDIYIPERNNFFGQNNNDPEADIMPLHCLEEIMIEKALKKYGSTVRGKEKAAQALNISLTTLYNKIRKQTQSVGNQ